MVVSYNANTDRYGIRDPASEYEHVLVPSAALDGRAHLLRHGRRCAAHIYPPRTMLMRVTAEPVRTLGGEV